MVILVFMVIKLIPPNSSNKFDFRIFLREKYDKYISIAQNEYAATATMGTKFILGEYYREIF